MVSIATRPHSNTVTAPVGADAARAGSATMTFDEIYAAHFDFVWRTARSLGVPEALCDDAVQDVFLVVHRRLGDFEGRSSIKTWLFGIVRRAIRPHRRAGQRARASDALDDRLADTAAPSPLASIERAEAMRLLEHLLDGLDDDKREAFVLIDLEQLTLADAAVALDANVHTVRARLRAARSELAEALARLRAGRRIP
jgi:RNA polymerase sigma-70 factor (ECF subfamily)